MVEHGMGGTALAKSQSFPAQPETSGQVTALQPGAGHGGQQAVTNRQEACAHRSHGWHGAVLELGSKTAQTPSPAFFIAPGCLALCFLYRPGK